MTITPAIEVKGLCSGYGRMQVLHGIDMTVPEGSVVTLLGANGAGKTTLLGSISGLVRPRAGRVSLFGDTVSGLETERIVARGLAHVPEGRQPFPRLSVRENLMMGAWARRRDKTVRDDYERVYAYFPILAERRDLHAGMLSGGEQQMLVIGRALMSRPRVLLLDEPSLGLSPKFTSAIFEIVGRINRDEGMTILLVEQNAGAALGVAHFGYVLESGHVVLGAPSDDLRRHDRVRAAYLGDAAEHAG